MYKPGNDILASHFPPTVTAPGVNEVNASTIFFLAAFTPANLANSKLTVIGRGESRIAWAAWNTVLTLIPLTNVRRAP